MKFRKLLALLLTVILPGLGHFIIRQYLRASLLLLLFVLLADGTVVGRMLIAPRNAELGGQMTLLCAAGAGCIWLAAVAHIFYLNFIFNEKAHRDRIEQLFQQGQQNYLRSQYDEAAAAFRRAVRLDPEDPDVRFYLGCTLREMGLKRKARSQLRKCRILDVQDKWEWEVKDAMAAFKKRP